MKLEGLAEAAQAEVTVRSQEEVIRILQRSLQPEVEKPSSTRSKASLKAEGPLLKLSITASDLTALRAALNSYLRWMQSITEVVDRTRSG